VQRLPVEKMTTQPVQIMQELSIDRKSQNSNQFTSKKILIKGDIEDEIDKISDDVV
jgi:hypothetical protein